MHCPRLQWFVTREERNVSYAGLLTTLIGKVAREKCGQPSMSMHGGIQP